MKIRFEQALLLGLLAVLAGCRSYGPGFDAHNPATFPPNKPADANFVSVDRTNQIQAEWLRPSTNLFTLGPGDSFEIEVLGEAGSRSSVFVGPDGKIYYGILPGMFVWGLTLSETRDLLEKELGKQMRIKPQIAITLRGVESKRFWMLGNLQKPGVYSLATPVTVLEAILLAGGTVQPPGSLEAVPDLQRSFLLRNGQLTQVDFHRLLAEGDLSQNLYLQPEDFIYLRSSTARSIYVLGAVAQPSIVPYTDRISLVGALASCGGTLPLSQVSHVAVVRGSLVQPKIAVVDYDAIRKGKIPDVRLEEGDIVYVSWQPYRKLVLLLEGALSQFVYAVSYNYGNKVGGGTTPINPTVPYAAPAP